MNISKMNYGIFTLVVLVNIFVIAFSYDLCSLGDDIINSKVRETLCNDGDTSVLLYFHEKADLDKLNFLPTVSRQNRRLEVKNYLQTHAKSVQNCALTQLSKLSVNYKSFWIVNAVEVKSINLVDLEELMKVCPPNGIFFIDKNHQRRRELPKKEVKPIQDKSSLAWNIEKINADKVWQLSVNGTGVTIATIDGGVNYKHVALKNNYRGATVNGKDIDYDHDYNWNDWAYESPYPSDNEGHGTNVAGIASGSQDSGIGVAGGSQWIAAKIFNYAGYSNDSWIIEAAQWVVCPFPVNDPDGQERCDLGADIVSCSWGGMTAHSKSSEQYINSWIKAGILPVYAVGNSGPECSTVVAPSTIAGVIGVGGTDKSDEVVGWSARGPGPSSDNYNVNTPAIVAPGLSIYGPSCDDTTSYVGFSGTSQACPHVAGTAALMISAEPTITVEKLTEYLLMSATKDTLKEPSTGKTSCGGKDWNDFTDGGNYIYGSGRLDALAAVTAVLNN